MKRKDNKYLLTATITLLAIITVFCSLCVHRSFTEQGIPTAIVSEATASLTTTTAPTSGTTATTAQKRQFSWSNADIQHMSNLLQGYDGQVSLYYEDLESGYTYSYNADQTYSAASLMKAPFCMYILQLAAEGKCDLSQKITYTAAFESTGTGVLKNQAFGTEYTVEKLIEYTIRNSDNAALRMLRSVFSVNGFKEFAASIGIENTASIGLITNSRITVKDATVYMHAIYDFIQKEPVYGKMLYEHMTNTRNPMFRSSYPLVRKYGWADAAFHDMAIVDAPHPYILILCTDHEDGTTGDFAMFRNVANQIEKISGQTE